MHLRVPLALAAAAALVATPMTAFADGGTQPHVEVSSKAGDPGLLEVTATSSDSTVESVDARIFLPGTTTEVWHHQLRQEGDLWTSDRVVLNGYHDYDVQVVATEADGDSNAEPGTLTLHYLKQPVVLSHTVGPLTLDLDHRVLEASGQVALLDPAEVDETQRVAPAVHSWVRVIHDGAEDGVWTDAEGRYAWSRKPYGDWDHGSRTYTQWDPAQSDPTIAPNPQFMDDVNDTVARSTPKIVLTTSATTVKYPTPVTFSGQLLHQDTVDGPWLPVPSAELKDYVGRSLTTDADGRFSTTFTPGSTESYTVSIPFDSNVAPFLGVYTSPVAKVQVVRKTYLRWTRQAINAFSELHVEGTLTYNGSGNPPKGTKVYLQQSKDGKTGWRYVYYVKTGSSGEFQVDGWVPHPTGYWRLVYLGSTTSQPSVSSVVQRSRIETRVRSFNAGPEPVRAGRYVTSTGVVQRYTSGAWRSIGKGQVVEVYFRAKGSTRYTYQGYARTTSTGSFSFRHKASKDGYWAAAWFTGSSRYVNAYSDDDYVDVR